MHGQLHFLGVRGESLDPVEPRAPTQADRIFDRSGPLSVRPIIYDERELERTLKLWRQQVY